MESESSVVRACEGGTSGALRCGSNARGAVRPSCVADATCQYDTRERRIYRGRGNSCDWSRCQAGPVPWQGRFGDAGQGWHRSPKLKSSFSGPAPSLTTPSHPACSSQSSLNPHFPLYRSKHAADLTLPSQRERAAAVCPGAGHTDARQARGRRVRKRFSNEWIVAHCGSKAVLSFWLFADCVSAADRARHWRARRVSRCRERCSNRAEQLTSRPRCAGR